MEMVYQEFANRLRTYVKLFLIFFIINFQIYSFKFNNFHKLDDENSDESFEYCSSLLQNCTCHDYGRTIGIICSYIDDFDEFSYALAKDLVSDVNITYEITLTEIEYLPSHSFKGLSIYRLYLDNEELKRIEKNVFEGTLVLRIFQVLRSSIQEIPDFVAIKNSLKSLYIDNSQLTALEGDALQNLLWLETISFVNNFIKYVDGNVFKGTTNVITFDLSHNKITHLPPNLIDSWKKLSKIVLSNNKLLEVDSLFAVTHPRIIYLDSNNLKNVESILQSNMKNVTTLYLTNNPIENLSNTSFNGKIPFIRSLYLDRCKIQEFNADHFRNLSNLKELDISWNNIQKVPKQLVDFGDKMELKMGGNRIDEFEAELSPTVIRFFLHDNSLLSLGKTLWFSQLMHISVARNNLQYLTESDFKGIHSTGNMELQENTIQWIDRYTFFSIRKDLNYLDLSSNFIRALNSSIRSLSQLVALNLSSNLIETFQEDDFTGLNELSELYLRNNRLVFLGLQLQQLSQLQFLDIRNNSLITLSPNQVPKTLRHIYLESNPFQCDCKLLSFLKWLNMSGAPGSDISPCTYDENPDFYTAIKQCPEPCTCACSEVKNKYFMYLDCGSRNISHLPLLLTKGIKYENEGLNSLKMLLNHRFEVEASTETQFRIHDQVLGVNLENNSIQSLDSVLVHPNLMQLHLARNKLKTVSTTFLYSLRNLQDVTLSENPWACDCNAVSFRKWLLSKMDLVTDINFTVCRENTQRPNLNGRVIWTLNDIDLCPLEITLYLVLFGILVFLLLCTGGIILYMQYRMPIKAWLYAHGFDFVKDDKLEEDKEYDAFFSFANEDIDFILFQILPVLEKYQPDTQLCIHTRDFLAGNDIESNIEHGIHSSKKTVVFLSEHFIKSFWCTFEFKTACYLSLKDNINRIIIVKMDELPEEQLPGMIVTHMKRTTYLTWGEKQFWERFFYVLPTSKSKERRVNSMLLEAVDLKVLPEYQRPLIT